MGLYLGGLIIRRIFGSETWGAYFREGLLSVLYGKSYAYQLQPDERIQAKELSLDSLQSAFCLLSSIKY